MYENTFHMTTTESGAELKVFFLFPRILAPFECFVINNVDFKTITQHIIDSLDSLQHIKLVIRCNIITKGSVTIYERDNNNSKINVKVVSQLIKDLLEDLKFMNAW